MAVDQKRRQKQLARKAAKRKAAVAAKKSTGGGGSFAAISKEATLAATYPVHECLVSKQLFDVGLGSVLVSRKLQSGMIAMSLFLVDVYCLGVKDAMFSVMDPEEYGLRLGKLAGTQTLEPAEPSCVRKLVEGAIAYAQDLGFAPHRDYEAAGRIFGEIDPAACLENYEFGKDGKPFYVSGPLDSPAKSKRIIDTLTERLGPEGFHFMAGGEL